MKSTSGLWWLLGVFALSCGMEDGDRCPKGYTYDADQNFCFSDKDGGAPADGQGKIGDACQKDAGSCSEEASYCLADPGTGEGYCTIQGCTAGGCPSGYACCDCTPIGMGQICPRVQEAQGILATLCQCES